MLYLLDKDVKTVKWNGQPLHEATSAIVKEDLNGDFILMVKYPIADTGIYRLIKEDMLIKAPVPVLGAQLFRIKKPVENDDNLEITAYHISDDVMQRSIKPMSIYRQGCATALSQMVQNAKTDLGDFSFASDITANHTFNTKETSTLYTVLMDGKHSILGTWEGELVRDNFVLTVKRARGQDRGVIISTHKNLKAYQRSQNSQGVVTRIHASSTFKAEGAEQDTVLNVTVDSPLINAYPYINEKEYQNNDLKSVEELRRWAEAKFTHEGIDKVSDAIKIEAYEIDGQEVHLGDTVNIKSRKHGVDLYKKAVAYEFDCLANDGKGEYLSIIFDDKADIGGSGHSSGMSQVASAILDVGLTAQELAIERAIENANKAFDAAFEMEKAAILDDIERSKADAEEHIEGIRRDVLAKTRDEAEKAIKELEVELKKAPSLDLQGLRDEINSVKETNRLQSLLLGNDGQTHYNKNRLDGDTNRTISIDDDHILLAGVDGGFKAGQTYTISFEALCKLADRHKVRFNFTTRNKVVRLRFETR